MSRRQLREHIFRLLFRREFYPAEELTEQAFLYFEQAEGIKAEDEQYIRDKFQNILENIEEIDLAVGEASKGWKLNRIGKAELTIMRIAIYEIKYDADVPKAVAINEAVELTKLYGEENSPAFVNGILGKIE